MIFFLWFVTAICSFQNFIYAKPLEDTTLHQESAASTEETTILKSTESLNDTTCSDDFIDFDNMTFSNTTSSSLMNDSTTSLDGINLNGETNNTSLDSTIVNGEANNSNNSLSHTQDSDKQSLNVADNSTTDEQLSNNSNKEHPLNTTNLEQESNAEHSFNDVTTINNMNNSSVPEVTETCAEEISVPKIGDVLDNLNLSSTTAVTIEMKQNDSKTTTVPTETSTLENDKTEPKQESKKSESEYNIKELFTY